MHYENDPKKNPDLVSDLMSEITAALTFEQKDERSSEQASTHIDTASIDSAHSIPKSNPSKPEHRKANSTATGSARKTCPIKEIICVFGVPHAGKSTYIMSNYEIGADVDEVLDIYHYQKQSAYPDHMPAMDAFILVTYLSYSLLEFDLHRILSRQKSETGRIIVEGTYLKKARRAPLLQTIKNHVGEDAIIRCVWISNPKRESRYTALDDKLPYDMPTTEEGFDEVIVVEVSTMEEVDLSDIEERAQAHRQRDRITEEDLLGYGHISKGAKARS